jgi:drug/metabolite transporter (DMT)-like permease
LACWCSSAGLAASGQAGALAGLGDRQWAWALATGAILTVYVATWYAALARAPALDVTAVLVLGAVVTALLDAAVNGEALAPQGLGLVLVTAGGLLIVAARPLRADRPAVR